MKLKGKLYKKIIQLTRFMDQILVQVTCPQKKSSLNEIIKMDDNQQAKSRTRNEYICKKLKAATRDIMRYKGSRNSRHVKQRATKL